MTDEPPNFQRCVILADESASWEIAGLRQLDRIVLVLSEFADATHLESPIDVVIFWNPAIPAAARWLQRHPKINRVRLTEALGSAQSGDPVLTTRVFIEREKFGEFVSATSFTTIKEPIVEPESSWQHLQTSCSEGLSGLSGDGWRHLHDSDEIGRCEREFLRHTGKTQDGIVSRFLNRPMSQLVTRLLLKFPITPSAWTLSILAVPFFAYLFLIRGDYIGFVAGTALFQLANILDGCDGEIARAKYLESERGVRLDAFCDLITNLLFVLCVSVGLFRHPNATGHAQPIYLFEGIAAVCMLAGRSASYAVGLLAPDTTRAPDRRDGVAIVDSSQRLFGGAMTALLIQLTKRDVIFFGFFLLALAGLSALILHIVFAFSAITLFLRLKNAGLRARNN